MRKKLSISFFLLFLIVILAVIILIINNFHAGKTSRVEFQNKAFVNVEIADDDIEREKGLMFRKQLDKNSGMLFVYDNEGIRYFWMKNTFIPLDMIFIDNDYKIINIESAVPCIDNNCNHYSSESPAKYVLEVNTGFCGKNNISVGDYVRIK